jgi:hypothetical protein
MLIMMVRILPITILMVGANAKEMRLEKYESL